MRWTIRVVRTLEKWNSRRFPGFPGDFCTKFQVNFPRQPKSQLMKTSAAGENFDEKCRRKKILSKSFLNSETQKVDAGVLTTQIGENR